MFNIGDDVICIDNSGRKFLTYNKIYTVVDVNPNGIDIMVVNDDGKVREVLLSRFAPLPTATTIPKAGTNSGNTATYHPHGISNSQDTKVAHKYVPPRFYPGTTNPIHPLDLWKYEMEAFYAAGCPENWNK
jgi:hypothetical protein